ncbi:BTB/POZ domain-containing protein 2 [Condylostylus longicornis]|uniref:BTB/POZ domain-containing protein 2 n=1 Tax=Condylostylus longicornis TaxID=2530218 RepID=UPI00244E4E5B|nr:BTB/POZ domain-containing protein 2 [Condylostylus longicornis]
MVLPFGLGSDGSTNRAQIPSAPPMDAGALMNYTRYIDFIVVNGDDRYMIRTERNVVLESSVELAKIINAGPKGSRLNDNHFQVHNVDKHDFELLVRFLETKFIKYRDHKHILRILELADRYNCPDLIIHCAKELDLQLTSAIVLDIFRSLWYYNRAPTANCNVITTQQQKDPQQQNPDKPPKTKKLDKPHPFTPEEHLAALLHNCLQLIDMHAELILTKPEICDLRFEELEVIAKRDALQIQSEITLFVCLADWSIEECKRKRLELTAENRRRVLGPLCYTPRYLTMSSRDFRKACDRVELLDNVEITLVLDALDGKRSNNLTQEQLNMLEKFKTPRPPYPKMPIHLSDRSNPRTYPKKMRKYAEKGEKNGCWDTFTLNCLTVVAFIFD